MTASTSTPFCNNAMQIVEKQVDNKEMIQTDMFGILKYPKEIQIENKKLENEKKKAEVQKQKEIKKKEEPEWQEFVLTFYTSLESENSSAGAVTCQGKKLSRGGVANNVIPQNTKIYLDKWGEVTVNDKGSNKHFSVDYRLDVFVERAYGESDTQYARRVNSYGVQKVKGYIVK
jgi:3D (Asp-Asp-Asp) domain-containing protein